MRHLGIPMSALLGLSVAAMVVGCNPTPVEKSAPDAATGPTARVDLPPLVKLEGSLPPEAHPDHSLRVDGLLARRAKHMDQAINVRGYLVELYECPEEAKRCERPHGFITDSPAGGEKRLMVVGFDERVQSVLKVGEQYVITGKYATRSRDGFFTSGGLLIYQTIDGLELPPEPKKTGRRPRFKGR